jgi:DNA polymerase III subunit epsilon
MKVILSESTLLDDKIDVRYPMRQISLDTETTGLSTEGGHRVIEIGCVEIVDRKLTGKTFHSYINPEREVEAGAFAVHGISTDFLCNKPKFCDLLEELLSFINGAELIIHNAPFDIGFLNHEFNLSNHPKNVTDYCTVFDTLPFARKRHPGQKNSLDALCKRYEIDNYLSMTGGQGTLFTDTDESMNKEENVVSLDLLARRHRTVSELSEQERRAHLEFVDILKKSGNDLWEEVE